jgi:hypothetical protein
MISFLPKITATMTEINRSLKLRAPKLSAYHRLRLMGLTTLRAVGSQTWDTAIAIASRDLYRPEPWIWDSFKSKK